MNVLFVSTNVGVVTCFMEQSTPLVMCSHAVCNLYQFNSPAQELKQHLPESSVVSLCVRIANI